MKVHVIGIVDEKAVDCRNQILSEIYFAYEKDKVSLYSNLFPVWSGGS